MNRSFYLIIATICSLLRAFGEPLLSQTPKPITPWGDFVESDFPFFSSPLDARKLGQAFPTNNLTPRGIVLNLGNGVWACMDVDLIRVSAIWEGRGVTATSMAQISYKSPGTKAVEGEEHLPEIVGEPWMADGIYPGWQSGEILSFDDPRTPCPDPNEVGRGALPSALGRFNAIRLKPEGACLEYEAAGHAVKEWIESRSSNGQPQVQRHFRLDRVRKPLLLVLGTKSKELSVASDAYPISEKNGTLFVRVPLSEKPVEFSVAMTRAGTAGPWKANTDLSPPKTRWAQTITTKANIASSTNAFVLDNIAIPEPNPWKRAVRLGDIAFFKDGRAATVTFDGDIWIIDGLGSDLAEVRWKRFASGLHEPMGLCIRDEQIFVFDRNGLWRLLDTDGNGEADVQELFSTAFAQTAETREYAHGIRCAPDGSFIIAKGGIQMTALGKDNGCVLRISPDGKSSTVLGYGFRSPYIGVHPKTGLVTASDQQGNYVPTTPLHVVRDHQYYGFLSRLLPKEKYPAPIAEPLTWIPYPVNSSGASQVWLTDARMGPLNDQLLHLGYFRPDIFVVLLNQRMPRMQAAVMSLTRELEFPPMNGAVNPRDGQVYVTGFQIFGTSAKQISGLARVRYTGLPYTLPTEIVPMDKGVLLRFPIALDASKATNYANYSAERWNYQRTANYGSPHFKLDGSKGQERMAPTSAYISNDGKSVFVGIPDMKPVMQMRFGWAIAGRAGTLLEQNAYFTPYELPAFHPAAEGFEQETVDLAAKSEQPAEETPITPEEGKRLSELLGCAACHSSDGVTLEKVGPTWKGLFGHEVAFADGSKALADENYVRESIREPAKRIVRGYEKGDISMPSYEGIITDSQLEALVLYIKSLH